MDDLVRKLAERVADYIETSITYQSWSKRDCAIEAVRIACEDAAHETVRLVADARIVALEAERDRLRRAALEAIRWHIACPEDADHVLAGLLDVSAGSTDSSTP